MPFTFECRVALDENMSSEVTWNLGRVDTAVPTSNRTHFSSSDSFTLSLGGGGRPSPKARVKDPRFPFEPDEVAA